MKKLIIIDAQALHLALSVFIPNHEASENAMAVIKERATAIVDPNRIMDLFNPDHES